MIGKLQGLIDYIGENSLIIMVSGVGYDVFVPNSLIIKYKEGDVVSLWIETHVREDHIHLFGFETKLDKEWFDLLQLVPGIGAKVALSILSALSSDEIVLAVQSNDSAKFSSISGIGKKMAERILIELKNKIKNLGDNNLFISESSSKNFSLSQIANDAILALENLGYKKANAKEVVEKIIKLDSNISFENLIKTALKEI